MNERIKQLRKNLGKTLEEFGAPIGLTRSAVSNIENGHRQLSNQAVISICREYNVNETWLRTGEGEMFIKLSRNDELAAYVGRILKDEDAELQRFLVQLMSRIPSDCWQVIEAKAKELAAEK